MWSSPAAGSTGKRLLVPLTLAAACLALLLTSPTDGNFWWSDAPRHALNGAFVKDIVTEAPWRHPVAWAVNYYIHYPALTIMFYPPLFYLVEAPVFAVLGVTQFAAQATVILFTFVLAIASYGIARTCVPRWSALGVSLLVIGAPEAAFWGRQIMLDVPAYAMVATAALCMIRYLDTDRPTLLLASVVATIAAVFIKLNAVFIAPALLVVFLVRKGWPAFRHRHVQWAGVLAALGVVGAALLTLRFGAGNIESVAGRPGDLPRWSLDAWLFYGKRFPEGMGLAAAVLALPGIVTLVQRRKQGSVAWVLMAWFLSAYAFYSLISLRDERLTLLMLLPLSMSAVLALHAWLSPRLAQVAALALGAGTCLYGVIGFPPPSIAGYQAVATYVAQHAPPGAGVVFSGERDGTFIFNMRGHDERRDLTIIRSDKLLLNVSIERVRGVEETPYDESAIAGMLRELGTDLIVYQPGFWEDLKPMARFAAVVHSPDYERVATFPISGTIDHDDKSIEIYRATYPVARTRQQIDINLPIIRERITGSLR